MLFDGSWRIPNSLEEVYSRHIIGKNELKSKIGRIHIGTDTEKSFMSTALILDLFDVAKLDENGIGQPEDEIPIVVSQIYISSHSTTTTSCPSCSSTPLHTT